ncbi:MAG: substrate-binding domain-containing protein [Gemmatimonadota bacterium]|nr:MAG: substrate-binding domain-containing protein [Gemmatimonadota bacterium]
MTEFGTKVLIAVPNFQSEMHSKLSEHFKKWLKPDEMILYSVSDDTAEQKERLERALAQDSPSAMIAISVRPESETISAFNSKQVPIVLIDEEMPGVSVITTDNYRGGYIAGEYLADNGRKELAVVAGRMKVRGGYNAEQRVKGFQAALRERGLLVPPERVIEVPHYSRSDGLEVMPQLLRMGIDAVFCAAGDNCAVGLLAAAREQRVRVPEDVAIIGFDDFRIAQISFPPLTTIRQPLEQIADAAYKMAAVQTADILSAPQRTTFEPELIVRKSA